MPTATAPTTIDLAPGLVVPLDLATQPIGIFGMRGSGKSNAAVVIAEQLWLAGVPFVALDPVDHWWGLKARADGTPGFAVYVFGGKHGDLPLEPTAGALMAEVVCESSRPIVLCTEQFLEGERARFVTEFALTLRRLMARNPHPLHVFLEEADEFIPQTPAKEELRMVSAVTKLVLRSRQDGIGATLISQRPARVKKDVTTQIEVLCAFRTIGPQDRDAIDNWIRYHESGGLRGEVLGGLASLGPGESFVWSPQWLEVFARVQWPRRQTFDAARTPRVGEQRVTPRLADVDLEALRVRMADTIERVKADDPALLRKEIAALRAQLAARPAATVERVEVPVLSDEARAALHTELETSREAIARETESLATVTRDIIAVLRTPAAPVAMVTRDNEARLVPPAPRAPAPAPRDRVDGDLRAGARRMLEVLARHHPMRMTRTQVGTLAKVAARGGTFSTYLSDLRRLDYIDVSGNEVTLTAAGLEAAGAVGAPPSTEDVLATWRRALRDGARRMLDALVAVYPEGLSRGELADRAGVSAAGGTFTTYLSDLRRNGLVETGREGVRASATLFLGGG